MDIQTISIVIAAAGVFIAAINSIYSSREAKEQRTVELKTQELALQAQQQALETRQAQLFMQVYSQWSSKEFQKAYGMVRFVYQWDTPEDWLNKYLPDKDVEAYGDFRVLTTFVNGLGVLAEKELIDLELVEELLGGRIV